MNHEIRDLGTPVAGDAVLALCKPQAGAAEGCYPLRPLTLVLGAAPGGGADILARTLVADIAEDLGQPVAIDYQPGASGNIGAARVARARSDGYTMLLSTRSATLHKTMYPYMDYDFARDLKPVGMVATMPIVVIMGNHVAAGDLLDAIELARFSPGRYVCASVGVGTTNHVLSEILQASAGMRFQHIPYQSSAAALNDVIAGLVDFLFTPLSAALPHIKSGRVCAVAVTSQLRIAEIPHVPTIEEVGFSEAGADDWYAVMVPTGTPPRVIGRLNRSLNTVLARAEVRSRLARLGYMAPG
ncbi:tripartite tricarboxylate transporter substrate binding protein [Bordetella sp. LUAb4]|uniref:Bug family tripartite tricarboxylate transporter substrate binding protein n=1 Tax=Bordetella sp. LUAb4 TaxID=2843195 RepID=UPI001E508952|nr:tripartite tricarboxylate transporter substrate-binding protein [Bordetella sp. LUAb4]